MPFASKPIIDEEKKKAPSTGGGGGVGMGLPGQDKTRGEKSSGSYANIQDYLKANQTQGAKMGSDIAGSVSKSAEQAKSDIGKLSAEAPKVAAYDPNKVISQVVGPVNTQDKSNYQAMKATGGYTGPESIEKTANYNAAQEATRKAASQVGLAGGEYGQQELLKQQYGRPQYTAGQNKLDQMLLQGSAAGKASMQNVRSKYADLENLFGGASEKTGAAIAAAQKQALANKQAIGQAETAAWKGLIDPIQARAEQLNKLRPAQADKYRKDLEDQFLEQSTLDLTGLKAGQNIYDLNLGSYLTPNLTEVGLDQAANVKERGKYQALADLFGDTTRKEIGAQGALPSAAAFNKEQFAKDLLAKEQERGDVLNKKTGIVAAANQPLYTQRMDSGAKVASKKTFNDIGGDISRMPVSKIESEWLPKMKDYVAKMEKEEEQRKKNNPSYVPVFDFTNAKKVIGEVEGQVNVIKNDPNASRKISKLGAFNIMPAIRGT